MNTAPADALTGALAQIRDRFAGLPQKPGARLQARPLQLQRRGRLLRSLQGRRPHQNQDSLLPHVYVICDVCHGHRYNRETLKVKFKGKSIAAVLDMTVEDAHELFKAVPPIRDKMAMLAITDRPGPPTAAAASGREKPRPKSSRNLA